MISTQPSLTDWQATSVDVWRWLFLPTWQRPVPELVYSSETEKTDPMCAASRSQTAGCSLQEESPKTGLQTANLMEPATSSSWWRYNRELVSGWKAPSTHCSIAMANASPEPSEWGPRPNTNRMRMNSEIGSLLYYRGRLYRTGCAKSLVTRPMCLLLIFAESLFFTALGPPRHCLLLQKMLCNIKVARPNDFR